MEDKTKIETTPSIYQQPLEDNRKIKTALTTNNQWKTNKNRNNTKYLPIIRNNRKIKTALTTNNQWKTKQK